MLLTDEVRQLMRQYEGSNPAEVALLASRFPERPFAFVAQQLKGRAKACRKLPSWHANDDVVYGPALALEQCSSEVVARYRANLAPESESGIDLTGGFGVDSRFLAERCDRFQYCERDATLARIAESNFAAFGLGGRVTVTVGDGVSAFDALSGPVGIAFVDPARRDARALKVSAFEDCEPDMGPLWPRLRAKAETVFVKASPGLDLTAALRLLDGVSAAHVIAVENECKEILFIADRTNPPEPEIVCVDLKRTGEAVAFRFLLCEERALAVRCGPPKAFLYEPNAAILNAGAFKSVGERFGAVALHPRTRLYSADHLIDGFPGRVFEIVGQGALNPKSAKALFPDGRANVISRNSGMTADELRRKLRLADGGELFAIGASLEGGRRALFACRLASR